MNKTTGNRMFIQSASIRGKPVSTAVVPDVGCVKRFRADAPTVRFKCPVKSQLFVSHVYRRCVSASRGSTHPTRTAVVARRVCRYNSAAVEKLRLTRIAIQHLDPVPPLQRAGLGAGDLWSERWITNCAKNAPT
jgi:hypothetical protein